MVVELVAAVVGEMCRPVAQRHAPRSIRAFRRAYPRSRSWSWRLWRVCGAATRRRWHPEAKGQPPEIDRQAHVCARLRHQRGNQRGRKLRLGRQRLCFGNDDLGGPVVPAFVARLFICIFLQLAPIISGQQFELARGCRLDSSRCSMRKRPSSLFAPASAGLRVAPQPTAPQRSRRRHAAIVAGNFDGLHAPPIAMPAALRQQRGGSARRARDRSWLASADG